MSAVQDFINQIMQVKQHTKSSQGDINQQMTKAGYTQNNFAPKVESNAARDVGNLAQFAETALNPLDPNNPLNVAVTQPQNVGKKTTDFVTNTAKGLNKVVGEPFNPDTGQLQTPSVGKAVVNAAENPVSTALLATGGPKGLPRIGKGAVEGEAAATTPLASTTRVTTKPSYYGAAKEDAIQKTVNDTVPGKSAVEKYANLEPTMTTLGARIQKELAVNPQDIPMSRIKNDFITNLQDQVLSKNLTSKAAQAEVDGLFKDLNIKGSQQDIPEGQVEATVHRPETINNTDLYGIKQKVNSLYQGVKKKLDNGTPLNPREQVIAVARQTLDDVLTDYNPEIKQLTTQQSHLYDAAPSLFKGREQEIKDAQAEIEREANRDYKLNILGTTMPGIIAKPLTKLGENIQGNIEDQFSNLPKLGKRVGLPPIGSLASGATKLVALNNVSNDVNGKTEYNPIDQESNHNIGQSVSHYTKNVNMDNQGHYILPKPETPITPFTPGTPEYTTAAAALPNNTRSFMTNAPLTSAAANRVIDDLSSMPLNIFTKFKTTQDVLSYASNPQNPYAKQVADLYGMNKVFTSAYQNVTGQTPDDSQLITPGLSPDQLQQRFAGMLQFVNDSYSQYYTPYAQTSETPSAKASPGGVVQYQQDQAPQSAPGMIQQNFPNLPPLGQ